MRRTWRNLVFTSFIVLSACSETAPPQTALDTRVRKLDDEPYQGRQWTLWSQWSGRTACLTNDCVVPSGLNLMLDQDVSIKNLTINGVFTIRDGADRRLEADSIMVHGRFELGTATEPHRAKVTLHLKGPINADVMSMGSRVFGIMQSGIVEFYGVAPIPFVRLADHARRNITTLRVESKLNVDGVDYRAWRPGDTVAVAPTDLYEGVRASTLNGQLELPDEVPLTDTRLYDISEVKAANCPEGTPARFCTDVGIDRKLNQARWGRIQTFTDPTTDNEVHFDQRAEVANLTRNIVIEGPRSDWEGGVGAHLMVMGNRATLRLSGVQLRNVGQEFKLGRYPIHFHMMSYDDAGNRLPTINASWVRNSTIVDSKNRCIVIHGTNDLEIADNVCFNISGHAIFFEDAVERDNQILRNLVLRVRNPPAGRALKRHEAAIFEGSSSGFWITNPDNTIVGNVAADIEGNGFWLAFPRYPVGLHKKVNLSPRLMKLQRFEDNTGHSNGSAGLFIDFPQISAQPDFVSNRDPARAAALVNEEAGEIEPLAYTPTENFAAWERRPDGTIFDRTTLGFNPDIIGTHTARLRSGDVVVEPITSARPANGRPQFTRFLRFNAYKNNAGGVWNRVAQPLFEDFRLSDNANRKPNAIGQTFGGFSGSSSGGIILGSAIAGITANNETPMPRNRPPVGVASYHGELVIRDNFFVNLPVVDIENGRSGGAISSDDFYLNPVENGFVNFVGNRLLNSDWAWKLRNPINLSTLSGAVWDPQGYFGPAGNHWVNDEPFFTSGGGCARVVTAGRSNSQSCDRPYIGIDRYVVRDPVTGALIEQKYSAFRMHRLDTGLNPAPVWEASRGSTISTLRHSALRSGGVYSLEFPEGYIRELDTSNAGNPATTQFINGVISEFRFQVKNLSLETTPNVNDGPTVGIPFPRSHNRVDVCALNKDESYFECTNGSGLQLREVRNINLVKTGDGGNFYHDRVRGRIWLKLGRRYAALPYQPHLAAVPDPLRPNEVLARRSNTGGFVIRARVPRGDPDSTEILSPSLRNRVLQQTDFQTLRQLNEAAVQEGRGGN